MDEYIESLKQRVNIVKKAVASAEKDALHFPEGRMRVSQSGKQVRYYHVIPPAERSISPAAPKDYSGTYIRAENIELAKRLAQKDYNESFLKTARDEIRILEFSIRSLLQKNTDMVYRQLDPRRQRLVVPYILTDELYEKQWKDQVFRSNPFMPEGKIYDTRNGEKVRSKTEAILADMFLELGIPYHYEKALMLNKGRVRYPDFTMLKIKTREEIYLEHFGLLDDEGYRNKCLHKLDEYRNNGIFPGKNLIITYESSESPFDILGTRKMIKELFRV